MNLCQKCLEKNDIYAGDINKPYRDMCELCLNITECYDISAKFINNIVVKNYNNPITVELSSIRNKFLYSKQVQKNLDEKIK